MTAERAAATAAAKALPPKPNSKSDGTDFDSSLLIIRILLPSFESSCCRFPQYQLFMLLLHLSMKASSTLLKLVKS